METSPAAFMHGTQTDGVDCGRDAQQKDERNPQDSEHHQCFGVPQVARAVSKQGIVPDEQGQTPSQKCTEHCPEDQARIKDWLLVVHCRDDPFSSLSRRERVPHTCPTLAFGQTKDTFPNDVLLNL